MLNAISKLDAEMINLRNENEKLKRGVTCLWCGHKFDVGKRSQMCKHLLVCKNHPLAKRCAVLKAKNVKLGKEVKKAERALRAERISNQVYRKFYEEYGPNDEDL